MPTIPVPNGEPVSALPRSQLIGRGPDDWPASSAWPGCCSSCPSASPRRPPEPRTDRRAFDRLTVGRSPGRAAVPPEKPATSPPRRGGRAERAVLQRSGRNRSGPTNRRTAFGPSHPQLDPERVQHRRCGHRILLTVLIRVPRAGLALVGTLTATAVLASALGQVTTAGALIVGSAALGTISGAAMAIGNALLQRTTEPRYLGRAGSVTSLCTLGLSPCSTRSPA
jgi:hypothetical protein